MRYVLTVLFCFSTLCASELLPIRDPLLECHRQATVFMMTDLDEVTLNEIRSNPKHAFVLWNPEVDPKQIKLPPNLIVLSRECSAEELKTLSYCEHFDFALFSKHLLPISRGYIEILSTFSEHTLVALPSDTPDMRHLNRYEFTQYTGEAKKHFFIKTQTLYRVRQKHFLSDPNDPVPIHDIESSFFKKQMKKEDANNLFRINWIPGINLISFKMLDGVHPSLQSLAVDIRRLYKSPHKFWHPTRMIVSNNGVKLTSPLTLNKKKKRIVRSKQLLKLASDLAKAEDRNQIPYYLDLICEYNKEMSGK